MQVLKRAYKVTYDVVDGADVLAVGAEYARGLWNFTRWCVVGNNWKLRKARGHFPIEDYRHLMPKYPGKGMIDKVMRKDEYFGRKLADRCFSYTIKDFDIAMKSWFSNVKTRPEMRPPKYAKEPRILTFEVGRNAKAVGPWTWRLTVLGSAHEGSRHATVRIHIRPGVKMRDVTLLRLRADGSGVANVDVEVIDAMDRPGFAGIDLGISNIAAVAFSNGDTILYNGRSILSSDRLYHKLEARTRPSGWKRGKEMTRPSKRSKDYRRKAGNIRRLAVHNLTRSIVDEAMRRDVGTLVVGDLSGIRKEKDFGKKTNQKLHAWPFDEITRQLIYKAEEVGIKVIQVSESYTSQTCSVCGTRNKTNRVHRGLYRCNVCGTEQNADINGARNIMARGIAKVSPGALALGVGAVFPGSPSPTVAASRIGKVKKASDGSAQPRATGSRGTQYHQTIVANAQHFAAKFDLRDWSIKMNRIAIETAKFQYNQTSGMA